MRASHSSLPLETSVVTVFACHSIQVSVLKLMLCGDVVENDLFSSVVVQAEFNASIAKAKGICNDKSLLRDRGERCRLTLNIGFHANRRLKPSIGFIIGGTSPTFCTLLRWPPQCTASLTPWRLLQQAVPRLSPLEALNDNSMPAKLVSEHGEPDELERLAGSHRRSIA
jgi:hypothetical protein